MMIFDVDMLKDILVKDASYFQNRYVRFLPRVLNGDLKDSAE